MQPSYIPTALYQADLVVGWPCSSPTLCEGRRGEARRGGGRDGPCGAARRPARVPEATASYSNNIIPRKFDSCVVRQRRSGDRNGPRPMYRPHVCPPCRANLCAPEPPDPAIPAAPAARPGLTRRDACTSGDGLQAYMSVIMSVDCLHALQACRWRLTGVRASAPHAAGASRCSAPRLAVAVQRTLARCQWDAAFPIAALKCWGPAARRAHQLTFSDSEPKKNPQTDENSPRPALP